MFYIMLALVILSVGLWVFKPEDEYLIEEATPMDKEATITCEKINAESQELFQQLITAANRKDPEGVKFFLDRIQETRHRYEETFMAWAKSRAEEGLAKAGQKQS
jgi:hypothetical protein